jgi:hypothetical protein
MSDPMLILDLDGLSTACVDDMQTAATEVAPGLAVSRLSQQTQRFLDADVVSAVAASVGVLVNTAAVVVQVLRDRRAAAEQEDDDLDRLRVEVRARLTTVPPEAEMLIAEIEASGLDAASLVLDVDGVTYRVELRRAGEIYFLIGRAPNR